VRPASPPTSEAQLRDRADAIAGRSLAALAAEQRCAVPADLRRAKGWVGTLIEASLGADAGSRPVPDFRLIGVELKTVPVDRHGRPRESTYVCTVPLLAREAPTWERSNVRRKLARVLWLPVEADPSLPIAERRVGSALLWSPSADEEAALRADWEELMDLICLGHIDQITARNGTHLQIRPKAADSHARRLGVDALGRFRPTSPRGFYLRSRFTAALLARHFVVAR